MQIIYEHPSKHMPIKLDNMLTHLMNLIYYSLLTDRQGRTSTRQLNPCIYPINALKVARITSEIEKSKNFDEDVFVEYSEKIPSSVNFLKKSKWIN